MKTKISASVLTVLLAFCGAVDARPPDYAFTLNLHQTAGDTTSDIDFTVTLGLLKDTQDGDDIGWKVQVVTIRAVDENGDVTDTWFKTYPDVDTEDELWWIEHADPDNPVNSEFLVLPFISGTAVQANPSEPTLEFEFEGAVYVAPPGGPPFPDTLALTTLLQEEDNPTPKKDEEDEPVEMPVEPSEPYPS